MAKPLGRSPSLGAQIEKIERQLIQLKTLEDGWVKHSSEVIRHTLDLQVLTVR
jgi:hypothetical protein